MLNHFTYGDTSHTVVVVAARSDTNELRTKIMKSRHPANDTSSDTDSRATHFVLGGRHVALAIAERLQTAGHAVIVVDEGYDATTVPGIDGSPTDLELLSESGMETASTVIAGTQSDARNFLIAQLVRARFDVPRIVVLVNDPEKESPLAEAGHEAFCVTTAVSESVTAAVSESATDIPSDTVRERA